MQIVEIQVRGGGGESVVLETQTGGFLVLQEIQVRGGGG